MTRFNWTFVRYTQQELLIQLDFENLNYISSRISDPDSIQVTIYGIQFFQDALGNLMLPRTILNVKELPPLASKSAIQETIELVTITKNTITGFVGMLFISGPVQQILSSFRHTQIIVHIMLIKVNQPATSLVFFSGLMELVNFQLIETSNFYNRIFRLDPDSDGNNPYSNQFEIMGYGSLYIVQNIGLLCITLFTPLIARFLLILVVMLLGDGVKIWKYDLSSLKEMSGKWLKYGYWISFLDETYLFLLVCASLNIRDYFEWQEVGDALNSLLSIVFGIILVVFPIFVAIFYSKEQNFERIKEGDQDFKARFGSIIEGLNFKRRQRWALFYPCLSLCRKLWLAYILVFQKDKPVFCIFCVLVQALLMIAVTGFVEPMTIVSKNRMQLFNEVFVAIISYHLIPLTEFMTDLDLRNNLVGKSLIVVTLFNLAVNILLALFQNFMQFKDRMQMMYARRKYRTGKKMEIQRRQLKISQQKAAPDLPRAESAASLSRSSLKDREAKQTSENLRLQYSELIQPERMINEVRQQVQLYNNRVETPSQLLACRDYLLDAFEDFSDQKQNFIRLSRDQVLQCKEKVEINKLGADLRPLGFIQGPVQVELEFTSPLEVVFVFNRPLRPSDIWDGQILRQLAFSAIEVRTLQEFKQHNLVSVKVRQDYSRSLGYAIQNIWGPRQQEINYADRGDSRAVILDREDRLPELNQKFPGLVKQKTLFTLISEYCEREIEVFCVKVDVEVVLLGIQVDGDEKFSQVVRIGSSSRDVEEVLTYLLREAHTLADDFPTSIEDDIRTGRFTERMKRYIRQRDSHDRPPGFIDFGDVKDLTSFERLVRVYIKICDSD